MSDPKHPTLPASSAGPFALGELEVSSLELHEGDGHRPVIIGAYSTAIEAELVKSRLEAEGIGCDLLDVHTVSIGGPLAIAVGGVKVRVRDDDEERARDVIAGIGTVALEEPADDDEDEMASVRHVEKASPDALAARALTSSVVGAVMLPPLGLYSLWLLWRALRAEGELTRKGRIKAVAALGFDALTSLWVLPFL